jgi:hypothetical protein
MDADAVRNEDPDRSDPDRIRNALLAAVVFELAVLAAGTANSDWSTWLASPSPSSSACSGSPRSSTTS